jgi:hypothetical protein
MSEIRTDLSILIGRLRLYAPRAASRLAPRAYMMEQSVAEVRTLAEEYCTIFKFGYLRSRQMYPLLHTHQEEEPLLTRIPYRSVLGRIELLQNTIRTADHYDKLGGYESVISRLLETPSFRMALREQVQLGEQVRKCHYVAQGLRLLRCSFMEREYVQTTLPLRRYLTIARHIFPQVIVQKQDMYRFVLETRRK